MKKSILKANKDTEKHQSNDPSHLIRQRINALLADAINNRVVLVRAGTGCGKTHAVSDFLCQQENPFFWFQLSENDNIAARFWENYTSVVSRYDAKIAAQYRELGFPDTKEKIDRYLKLRSDALKNRGGILVLDDFHFIKEPSVLRFVETIIADTPSDSTIILICRNLPDINEAFQIKGFVSEIQEADLHFTEGELTKYLSQQGLPSDRQTIYEIYKDTKGWALAVNLVARSLQRSPNYFGYIKNTLKNNIFKLMEYECWDNIPERLQRFLARLSLINHLSTKLVEILAGNDNGLIFGLKQQSAYIRFDTYIGAYLIHHSYLDFLRTKQDILTADEKRDVYKAAAEWCKKNSYKLDALSYYEKVCDYESIVSLLWELCEHTSYDLSLYVIGIFERAPAEVFDRVNFFAAMHLYTLLCLNRWKEFNTLAESYEKKFLTLPDNDVFRNYTLGVIYFFWSYARFLMCSFDDRYDFDVYLGKAAECLTKPSSGLFQTLVAPLGSWGSAVGNTRTGAPQEFVEATIRLMQHVSSCFNSTSGLDELCRGELKFYQGDFRAAEPIFYQALEQGRKYKQFEVVQRSLFYILRMSILQGKREKAAQPLKDLEPLLAENEYSRRFITHDIVLGWYYCFIRQYETVPEWLKGDFSPYCHAYFIENFGNQIKARYCYLARDFQPLLSYIKEMKQRESILYGKIEMLATEACVHYQMGNKAAAWVALKEAYDAAAPNDIITPFIELGKDMRTLATAAIRNMSDHAESEETASIIVIPRAWLESVRYRATSYAKIQSVFISEYMKTGGTGSVLTARERDILSDLYQGLSHPEIAGKRNLSVSTVKMITKIIYEKLDVHKMSELIKKTAELKLV